MWCPYSWAVMYAVAKSPPAPNCDWSWFRKSRSKYTSWSAGQ